MRVFSYDFFVLWGLTALLFYTVARRWQWQILAIASVLFYIASVDKVPWILLAVWLVTYCGARYADSHKGDNKSKIVFVLTVIISLSALILGRATSFFALLGNSYFTLKAIGYAIDVYYRGERHEENIFKYLLYLIYWPTVLEGPFIRIREFEENFCAGIRFNYDCFTHGIQRFIWGGAKKIVIAERLGLLVSALLSEPEGKGGRFIILAIAAYAIQLYSDFSGFMDMMLGVSLTFGIRLPENFKQPYFAKSVSEFWRRWHITLGLWFRDYIMFPFTSCAAIKGMAKKIRRKNKGLGKLIPIWMGTCLVWILTGLWHSFSKNYLLWGCYYASLIGCAQAYSILFDNGRKKEMRKGAWLKNGLSILRTLLLVLAADSIVCVSGLSNVKASWKEILFNFGGGSIQSVISAGITVKDFWILGIGMLLMLAVSLMKERNQSVQLKLDSAPIVIRWMVYYALLFAILIFGLYGSEYDVSQFMYMQF